MFLSRSLSVYVSKPISKTRGSFTQIKLNRENERESNFVTTWVHNILTTQRSQRNVLCEQPLTRTSMPKSTPHQYLRIPLGLP